MILVVLAVGLLVIFLVSHNRHIKLRDYSVFNGEADRLSLDIFVIAVGVLRNHRLRQGILAVGKSLDYGIVLAVGLECDLVSADHSVQSIVTLLNNYILKRILSLCVVQRQGKLRSLDLSAGYLLFGDVNR